MFNFDFKNVIIFSYFSAINTGDYRNDLFFFYFGFKLG